MVLSFLQLSRPKHHLRHITWNSLQIQTTGFVAISKYTPLHNDTAPPHWPTFPKGA